LSQNFVESDDRVLGSRENIPGRFGLAARDVRDFVSQKAVDIDDLSIVDFPLSHQKENLASAKNRSKQIDINHVFHVFSVFLVQQVSILERTGTIDQH
jgi:hypothetical protein